MLVLTRKSGESIAIGSEIRVVVVQIRGKQVRIGIEAPDDKRILREEIGKKIITQNHEALGSFDPVKKVANPGPAS